MGKEVHLKVGDDRMLCDEGTPYNTARPGRGVIPEHRMTRYLGKVTCCNCRGSPRWEEVERLAKHDHWDGRFDDA